MDEKDQDSGQTMNKDKAKKLMILVGIAAAAAAIYKSGLLDMLSLDYIKSSQAEFAKSYADNPALVLGVFFVIYVIATALSLPGAAVLTLAGGGLFGFWIGTLVVSFASTIGATFACAGSRFILRDWVEKKFGDKIAPINKGVEQEGAFYLFTLRLVPIFPFFMINLVLGITKMPLRTFFFVSQIGMLAGTMVFVNAGKELAKLDSLSGILSPSLIGSFVILGVFPIAIKKLVEKFRPAKPVAE